MPVFKYHNIDEMPGLAKVELPSLPVRIRALWNRSFALSECVPPRGVFRFSGIREANAARANWTNERMRRSGTSGR